MPDLVGPVSVAPGAVAPGSVAPDSDFELGRSALLEITSAESIGAPAGSIDEGDGVTTVYFETLLTGYPGWRWTASIAHVDDTPASVLETELTPGEAALLSPAWVPWVDRLADYTAAQDTAVEDDETNDELDDDESEGDDDDDDDESEGDDDDDDDDDDDESDEREDDESDDEDDDDDFGSDVLHGGDLDGVDIDESDGDDDDIDEDDDTDDDDYTDDEPEDEHERSV